MTKVKINGQVYNLVSYLSENVGSRANPEMYLKQVVVEVDGVETTFTADTNRIEIGGWL